MRIGKIGYWLYQPYKYLILVPILIVDTVLFTALTWVFSMISARLAGKAAVSWAKVMQWCTPSPVKLVGRENIVDGQSYVVMANHQGAYDILAMYGSLPIDFRWVMKKELRDVPLLGFACELCGHIFIDRSSARASYQSIQKAKETLTDGVSVVIFPEGTRSGSRAMRPFKHGGFKMAYDLELPILPVSIKDTYKVMPGGLHTLLPGRITLTIHEPIDVSAYEGRREELIARVRETIDTAL